MDSTLVHYRPKYFKYVKSCWANSGKGLFSVYGFIRDLKILEAAAIKTAVSSEGVWVETATTAREKQMLSCELAAVTTDIK